MAQNLKPNRSDNRGGKRQGAGAKKSDTPRRNVTFWLSEEEETKTREFVETLKT